MVSPSIHVNVCIVVKCRSFIGNSLTTGVGLVTFITIVDS